MPYRVVQTAAYHGHMSLISDLLAKAQLHAKGDALQVLQKLEVTVLSGHVSGMNDTLLNYAERLTQAEEKVVSGAEIMRISELLTLAQFGAVDRFRHRRHLQVAVLRHRLGSALRFKVPDRGCGETPGVSCADPGRFALQICCRKRDRRECRRPSRPRGNRRKSEGNGHACLYIRCGSPQRGIRILCAAGKETVGKTVETAQRILAT